MEIGLYLLGRFALIEFLREIEIVRNHRSLLLINIYQLAWSPRRYCKYAVTKRPAIVTGTNPKTIPDNKGSTIIIF